MTSVSTPERRQPVGWLIRGYFRPELPLAGVLFLVVLVVIALELAMPLIAGRFIDRALADEPVGGLRELAVLFIVAAGLFVVVRIVQAYLSERLAMNATNRLRTDLIRHCLRLDSTFHSRYRPGELVERIEGDVSALGALLSTVLVMVVGNVLLLIGILITLFALDWRLGLLLTGFAVVIGVVLNALRDRATPMWAAAMQADAEQSGFVAEQLGAREDIRSSGATAYALRGFTMQVRQVLARNVTASMRTGSLERITETIFTISLAACLGLGAWLVTTQGVTIASIYLIYRYVDLLGYPIYRLNRQVTVLQRAGAAVGRVGELLAFRSAVTDGRGAVPATGAPAVEVDAVTYGYEAARPVLHDVSFVVPAGARLGLIGRTGSGKTTIARLLLRFADPDSGAVRIGGVNLRDMAVVDVRQRVGLVTQDVQIMQMSLRDNLTFFDRTVPDERIVAALEKLGLDRLLANLPNGLDTVLRADDSGLSAGEEQMLALARVFLLDPQVVILDEATSRLDVATERRIDQAIDRLLEGRTAVVIAHRLSTIQRMTHVVLLEGGRVVESGERTELERDPDSKFTRLVQLDREQVTT